MIHTEQYNGAQYGDGVGVANNLNSSSWIHNLKRQRLETKAVVQICQVSHAGAHCTTTQDKVTLRQRDKTQIATEFDL